MQTYILTDAANLYQRQASMTTSQYGVDVRVGMALHMTLTSMRKEYNQWSGSHMVVFLEGRSWRKDVYPQYKAQRKLAAQQKTEEEIAESKALWTAFDDFVDFLRNQTNVTVVRNEQAEADDCIATWVKTHPNDRNIIISTDSDFYQLLKYENTMIYEPVKNIIIKHDGVFDENMNRVSYKMDTNAKIKLDKEQPSIVLPPEDGWHDYALFLKCVRGDSGDNVMSAYPGVREKSTKNKIGIREAYEDRINKGFSWNNFFNQKWTDHEDNEIIVRDSYERNRQLIDLSRIPEEIEQSIIDTFDMATSKTAPPAIQIGMGFIRFCGKWNLQNIGKSNQDFMPMFMGKYENV